MRILKQHYSSMADHFAAALESEFDVSATRVVGAEFRRTNKELLEQFFRSVKLNTGNWVYNGYRWHGYSFGHEKAIAGDRAFSEYRRQTMCPFYIFHEFDDALFDCRALSWPDVRVFNNDIYVFPHGYEWLFTTTHESSMGLGPYFAQPGA